MGTQIEKIFEILNDWRLLPNYQLERRADIFFALYLPEIIKQKFDIEITYDNIIPEFPLRKGTVSEKEKDSRSRNLSYKVDYTVITATKVFFIELKTDTNSIRNSQIEYLIDSQKANWKTLIDGILDIVKASKSTKYNHLLKKLREDHKCIDENNQNIAENKPIEPIKIVYILPQEDELLKEKEIPMITFAEVIEAIKGNKDELTRHFVESLNKWQNQI